jgi:hypothetical protein
LKLAQATGSQDLISKTKQNKQTNKKGLVAQGTGLEFKP